MSVIETTDRVLAEPPPGASAGEAGARATAGRVLVRHTHERDFPAIRELQRLTYPTIEPWSDEQLASQLAHFADGQYVAEIDGKVVGASASLVVQWDEYGVDHTWKTVTGNGTFSTYDPQGRTLYGAEVVVARNARGGGIGRALYRARDQLCRALGLRRIIAAGRLPGYHKVRDRMSPELYAMRVIWGDIDDPVLGFQLSQGFHYCGIIHNYLPEDRESCGNAALIVRLNPDLARRRKKRPAGAAEGK